MKKRIGILTSGGDCPGLNAVIRAVVSHATLTYEWEVLGIPYATQGLLERKSEILNVHGLELHGLDPLLSMGGTILGSINKGDTEARAEEAIAGYRELGLDALIAIGGEGSLAILYKLAQKGGWKLVGVPKTIDNDVPFTERSVGFDSAVNTITDALYRLSFTAASHDRVMVVEVMGRDVGHLALHAGIAGGADVILIPEIPYSIAGVCRHIDNLRNQWGRKFAIVVVVEGAKTPDGESRVYTDAHGEVRLRGIGEYITDQIARCSGNHVETRVTVLGHVQRGGTPSVPRPPDDVLLLVKRRWTWLHGNSSVQMVAWQNGQVVSVPLEDVFHNSPRPVKPDDFLVQTARGLGVYIGEVAEVES
uniref:ATP-dependent 6-phosphofructokinase n=1 Tax=Desertifilum tharense IPPAS B-1220 TaxID=1781255 RepID=A0ACD5H456_9CYAN